MTKLISILSIITILIYTEEQFIGALAGMNWEINERSLRRIHERDMRRIQFLFYMHREIKAGDPTDLPILAQRHEDFRKAKEARKAAEEAEKKKKENEDAERRKAMEDKRAAEEQERKRKAEQDRKNTDDAERLRNEEAQGDGCSYKPLNCKPTEFHGDSDPVIVTNWLKEIEDIFEISECSRGQWLKYASHLLKGEVRHWWNMIKIARGNEVVSAMTWEQFEELVIWTYEFIN